jgi:hypothetical protein
VVFKFDESLLEGFHGGQIALNPSGVTLDDLTIDTLKQKLQVTNSIICVCYILSGAKT